MFFDHHAYFNDRRLRARPDDRRLFDDPRVAHYVMSAHREALWQGVEGAADQLRTLVRRPRFRLEDVAVPVFFWHGDDDATTPLRAALALARKIPGAVLIRREGRAHHLLRDAEEFERILRALLDGDFHDAPASASVARPAAPEGPPLTAPQRWLRMFSRAA
jgi:pimeloyl-ACP methyl ester carboxylesterase